MSNITASRVDALEKDNRLAITCRYNNVDKYAISNQKAIAPYLQIGGLPSLREPLIVQNAMSQKNGAKIGNGQAVIMPPDVCFSFKLGYLCSLGFSYVVTLLPVNQVIRKDAIWPRVPPTNLDWSYAMVDKWQNDKYITVADAQFANTGSLSPEQANYVDKSFQIRVDITPMTSFTMADGTLYSEVMAAPGAMATPPPGGGVGVDTNELALNTHNGTIGQGAQGSKTHYTTVKGWTVDESRTTSVVFDVLVMNEKYYKRENAEIFSNPSLSD